MKKWSVPAMCVALLIPFAAHSRSPEPQWPEEEHNKAISQHSDFLLIRYDTGCTVKQSYSDPDLMELAYSEGEMNVLNPFYRGVEGDVVYWVDDNEKNTFKKEAVNANNSLPPIPPHIVKQMKKGNNLHVHVNPVGEAERTQVFGLQGLTQSMEMAASGECAVESAGNTNALAVELVRSDDGLLVRGETSLPDGMKMTVEVSRHSGGHVGSGKIVVENGSYRTESIRSDDGPVPAGKYVVSFASPMWGLQPDSVSDDLDKGNELPEVIREKSFGEFVVDYVVVRELE